MEESQQKPSPMAVIVDVASNPSFSASLKPVCILPVSILQHYHQGKHLDALMKLINTSFSSCHIVVAGTLNKYNFMVTRALKKHGDYTLSTHEQNTAYHEALVAEKKWIEKHQPILNTLTIPCEITGWDHWISQTDYAMHKTLIDKKYAENGSFSLKVRKAIEGFVDNKYTFESIEQQEAVKNHAVNYVLEELAVTLLWRDKDAYVLYPTTHSNIARKLKEIFNDISPHASLKFADVTFIKPDTVFNKTEEKKTQTLRESLEFIKAFSEGLARSGRPPQYVGNCFASALRSLEIPF